MNRGQIRSRAALHAEDPQQTRFSGYYNDAIDEANVQFALDTKCIFKDAPTYTVVAAQAAYDLPTDFMYEKQVQFKGLDLIPISRATLGFYKTSDRWDDDNGTPQYYVIDPEEARKKITLFPIPNSDDAGANLVLTYHPKPVAMTSDADIPLNSSLLLVQFHEAIAQYAAWLLLGFNSQSNEIIAKRNMLLKYYADKVSETVEKFDNTVSEPVRLRGGRVWR